MPIIRPPELTKLTPKEKAKFAWHNRDVATTNFEIAVAPETDYLVIGVYGDPEVIEQVWSWCQGHTFIERSTLYLERKTLYAHGAPVGRVKASQARETRYGKKLVFHFTGSWFRAADTGRGAGLNERAALKFIRLWANHLVKEGIAPPSWIKFFSIDRWDCCLELKTDLPIWDIAERITLPDRWNFRQGEWSSTGHTVYAGRTKSPKANRGRYNHLAVYREFDRPDRVRVEVRCVKIRHCDPDESLGQENAAVLAHQILDCFSPVPLEIGDRPGAVKPLDFEMEAVPEEITRVPYSGHAPATLRRMIRCGMTMLQRSVRSTVVATILASPVIMETIDIAEYGLPHPDEREYPDDHGNLSYDPVSPGALDDALVQDTRPFDHGASLRELSQAQVLNLDECYETIAVLYDYIKVKYPDALPYHEERRDHVRAVTLTQPSRERRCASPEDDFASELLCVPCSSAVTRPAGEWVSESPVMHAFHHFSTVIESDEHYVKRYLQPYDHEPLRSTKRWQAVSHGELLTFFRPGERGSLDEGKMLEAGSVEKFAPAGSWSKKDFKA